MTDSRELTQILTRLSDMEKRTSSEKVWDIAIKAMIPAVLAVSAWVLAQEARLTRLEFHAEHSPPQWLRNDIGSIKTTLLDIESRLRTIEHPKAK